MNLNTITEVKRPRSLDEIPEWHEGYAWLAGGTWLYSTPQISTGGRAISAQNKYTVQGAQRPRVFQLQGIRGLAGCLRQPDQRRNALREF